MDYATFLSEIEMKYLIIIAYILSALTMAVLIHDAYKQSKNVARFTNSRK